MGCLPITYQEYKDYYLVGAIPAISAAGIITVSYILLTLIVCCSTKVARWNRAVTEFAVEIVFGNFLKIHEERKETNERDRLLNNSKEEKVYIVFNHKAPNYFKYWLFHVLVDLIAVISIQFWEEFLLRESRICITSPGLSCFPVKPNFNAQRLDCSDTNYLEANNITSVICYRFAFRLGAAFGSATGIVTFNGLGLLFYIKIMLWLSDKTKKIEYQIFISILKLIVGLIALAVLVVSGFIISFSSSSSLKFTTVFCKYYLLSITVPKNIWNFRWNKFENIADTDKKDVNLQDQT